MCLILYSTTSVAFAALTPDHLRRAWDGNPDGFGMAYRVKKKDRVHVEKGLMSLAKAEKAIDALRLLNPVEVALHFRFATHGSAKPRLTHPFETDHGAFIHNGVLSLSSMDLDPAGSDTSTLARMLRGVRPADARVLSEPYRNGSRLLYLAHKPSQTWRKGDWHKTIVPGLVMSQAYSLPELKAYKEPTIGWSKTPYAPWPQDTLPVDSASLMARYRANRVVPLPPMDELTPDDGGFGL